MMLRRVIFALVAVVPSFALAAVEVDTVRLGQGVKAWYAANEVVPVVHVVLSFAGAGSVSDPVDKAGRSALAASMLTEGAGDLDSAAFQRALEDKAIDISIDSSDDRLTIHVHALREQAVAAGKLLALALSQPRFDAMDLTRVKGQTLSALSRLEESPSYQAARRFEEVAFAGHPYAAAHYGTKQSLSVITADDLRNYLSTYVARGNLLVTAAGDVDGSLLRDMLGPVVDVLGSSDAGSQPVSKVTMQGAGTNVKVPMSVPQSAVLFAAPGLPRDDARFYGYFLLNEVLGGSSLTARLADALRQKKGLVYGVSTDIDIRDGAALLRGELASRTDRTEEAIAAVRGVLSEMRTRGVTTQECEDARTNSLGKYVLQLDSSKSIAATLMMMRMYDLGEDYLEEREAKFKAVRCADVNALANELLDPARFMFVTAGAP